jgi:hypothetical protein
VAVESQTVSQKNNPAASSASRPGATAPADEPATEQGTGLERRVEQLERANAELRRVNAGLAREHMGKRDAAAASVLVRLQKAEARADKVERSFSYRITAPLRVFKPAWEKLDPWLRGVRERIRLRLGRS